MPRSLDVVLSLTAVVALSPLILMIALANALITGAVLFQQIRVGRGLKPFVILKFQTMRAGADHGSSITTAGDQRITPFGRFLRAAKLDELPQLINVLRGEMSLVGPRALTPNEVARIPPDISARVYAVRPGMTGLASLALTNEEQVLAGAGDPEAFYYDSILPQKVAWESLYVQRKSVWLDLLILLCTPTAILFPAAVRRIVQRFRVIAPASSSRAEEHA